MNRLLNNNTIVISLILLIGGLIFIPLIGNCPLFDWDEINFAECAREMVVSGDFTKVQINYQPFWEKPPFFIWMQAISMKIFGINEFAARFPNALCGIVSLLTLFLIGKRFFSAKFGVIWAITHCATLLPHIYFKSGIIDPWFNYFIFISIVFFIISERQNNKNSILHLVFSGVFVGIAVLTKGPAAILIVGTCVFIYLLFTKKINFIIGPRFAVYLLVIILTSASWFLFEYLSGNKQVIDEFIDYQIRLFKTEDSGHSGPFIYHAVVLLIGCFPASIIFLLSYSKKENLHGNQRQLRLMLLILFWVVLILFSIVKTKIVHYSSLCYFPITFITSLGLYQGNYKFNVFNKFLFILITVSISLSLAIFSQINSIKTWLLKSDLIGDDFFKMNLETTLTFTGFEILIPLLFLTSMILIYKAMNKNNIRILIYGFLLNIIFIITAINTFVPKAEYISQEAAISFYKIISKQDCYVETNKFKSYAYLFYSNRMPSHYVNKNQNDYINEFLDKYEKEGHSRLNSYATANIEWMKHGNIDKPAYIVCKSIHDEEMKPYSDIKKLYSKNGYSFFVRMPLHDK